MSRRLFFAAIRIILPLAIVGVALPAAAEVRPIDPNELARCGAISGGNERLACYDALTVVAVPGIQITPATVAAPARGPATPAAVAAPVTQSDAGGSAASQPVPAARSVDPDDPTSASPDSS
jgi:hypothetical protein